MAAKNRNQKPVYIIDSARSPFLRARGRPGNFSASDLALNAARPLMLRQPFEATDLDEVILGCIIPAANEANIARVVSLRLGCGHRVPAWTVQRNCGSGLQAVDSAFRNIANGYSSLVLAGGTEAMSHAPLMLNRHMVEWLSDFSRSRSVAEKLKCLARFRPGHLKPVISLLLGLTDPVVGLSMGRTAEILADRFGISRSDMDAFAVDSHLRLLAARKEGRLSEIEAIFDQKGKLYEEDDGARPDTSPESLARLKPVFDRPHGKVTAGNSAQVTDGAAWLLLAGEDAVEKYGLVPKARIVDCTWAGLDPKQMGLGPVYAISRLLERNKLKLAEIDEWEINEAFATQVLACLRAMADKSFCREELGRSKPLGEIDRDHLNVDGGGISLGHPVGASGARITLHLQRTLSARQAHYGVASLCIGGGQGGAMLLENVHEQAIDITSLKHIRLERDSNNIAWLTFDQKNSRANVLGAEMFSELDRALDNISQEPPAGVVFQSAKPSGFIVGADVKAFTRVDTEIQAKEIVQTGQSMFNRIEALPVPTVALIHGFCLGGGLELALACDYRITCDDEPARIGLPEVLLGIHPGFGGTVRLIRLIGVIPAMTLMLQGRTVDGRKAGRLGIVDEVIPRRHFRLAAEKRIRTKPGTSRAALHWRLLELGLFRPLVALLLRRQVASKVNADHYPAPFALIDLWRHHGGNAKAMMDGEADSIGRLFIQPTTKRLVRVFLLQERLKNLGNAESGFECRHVHVIGAGVMGGDIAAWCAYKGLRVTLQDREPEFIGPAMQRANRLFNQRIRDKYERQAACDRLIPDHAGHGVRHADVVIEAIIENLDAKTLLFQDILPRMKSTAVLATNTSSIPLEKLASRLGEPSRLIGLHFFNPVSRMQLVEVINAKQTASEQVQHGMVFTRAIDRLPLPVKSSPGFLVNRVLLPYLVEAVILLEEGVSATTIDQAATNFGMPMGPILLADTVGLDICHSVAKILSGAIDMQVPKLLGEKVEQGHLGKKSGQGFYTYKKGKPVDEDKNLATSLTETDIRERLILRMLNECVTCLREGIVEDGALLDAGMIFGTGFAPFRGGPMHYLEDRGISDTRKLLEEYQQRFGERFAPDPGWVDLHKLI